MTVSYSLAPNPKWYIADLVGRPLGGGYMATFSNLDHTLLNPVFQDPGGVFPWPYVTIPNVGSLGILFDENGSQGPFYFKLDTSLPDELYYLEVYDSDGVLQWTIDDFTPGSGGGGTITTAVNLENILTNGVFWRNIGGPTSTTTFMKLAPGAHAALAQTASNAGPDICFIKNNTNATDTIEFVPFTLGSTPFTGDITPVDYLKYVCTNTPAGETQKIVQFPITHSVQNLSNQDMTVTLWARGNTGTTTLTLQWFQFFGDGASASPSVTTPIQTISLSTSWEKFVLDSTIPSVSGMSLGECGNDALFLQIQYPLGVSCDIDFTKVCAYVGNLSPEDEYETYDMTDAVINAPRTGDIKGAFFDVTTGLNPGWLLIADQSIGATGSGATVTGTIYFPLYNAIWNNVSNTYAPVSTGRGASAAADFEAGKTLTLPKFLGRVLGSYGAGSGLTSRACGEFTGAESHLITLPDLPNPLGQVHGADGTGGTDLGPPPYGSVVGWQAGPAGGSDGINVTNVASTGSPISIVQPSIFTQVYIKL